MTKTSTNAFENTFHKSSQLQQQMNIFNNSCITPTHYSVPWLDPTLFSFNKAVSISYKCNLHSSMKDLINEKNTVQVIVSLTSKYILMASKKRAVGLIQLEEIDKRDTRIIEIVLPTPEGTVSPPFINLIRSSSDTNESISNLELNINAIGIVIISRTGKIHYWSRWTDALQNSSDYAIFQLSLGFHEEVTWVTTDIPKASLYQIIIGTSIGNVYLVELAGSSISETILYETTVPSTRLGSLWSRFLPTGNKENINVSINKVMRGHHREEIVVLSSLFIQTWRLSSTNGNTLVSRMDLQTSIQQYAAPLLLPQELASNVQIRILDIDKYGESDWAVLVSYSVPEMGRFSQYAVIGMKQQSTMKQDDQTPYIFTNAYSLPYSTVLDTLKKRPDIQVSHGTIAFITFDDAVVSIALTSSSLYEHTLVLRNDHVQNQIIGTTVMKDLDESIDNTTLASALVFTTESGILKYTVDQHFISKSQLEGNMYAIDYENAQSRDMDLARSQLEQAIFFGFSKQNPLYFPIRLEKQYNLGEVALGLAQDIIHGDLVTRTQDIKVNMENVIKFVERIPKVIKKEGWMDMMGRKSISDLLAIIGSYHIGIKIMDFCNEKRSSDSEMLERVKYCMIHSINNALGADLIDDTDNLDSSLHEVLTNHILQVLKCFEYLNPHLSYYPKFGSTEHCLVVYTITHFIKEILSSVWLLERCFVNEYIPESNTDDNSPLVDIFGVAQILGTQFKEIKKCLSQAENNMTDVYHDLCTLLREYGVILLNIYQEKIQADSSYTEKYRNDQHTIIKTFWDLNMQDYAVSLAIQYKDCGMLVIYSQCQSPITCQQMTEQYIKTYGDDFVYHLLSYYSENGFEEELLHFDPAYEHIVTKILEKKPRTALKYHMKYHNYGLVSDIFYKLATSETSIYEKKMLFCQAKLYFLADKTDKDNSIPISTTLVSSELKRITIQLEMMESQERLSANFKDLLPGQSFDGTKKQVEYIIRRTASNFFENNPSSDEFSISYHDLLCGNALKPIKFISLLKSMDNEGGKIENYVSALYFTQLLSNDGNTDDPRIIVNDIWKTIYLRDDWERLDQCVKGYSNIESLALLRQTVMYRVLLLCKKQDGLDEYILQPGELQLYPSLDDKDQILDRYIQQHDLKNYFDQSMHAISLL
ncbi:uncharacterized protein BX664DRAFT_324933 [Halteromyces radiatus]|uniref:uncharacterized protein n=1 Tax=Halteromyces radiatus TaxID=101107 RepID=UPI0022204184|nr:uncharacterized protein BX664DRAFT_324933 [Halteromyces radiatus]KAI8096810.1 hypothetical protein BX664DRAFT_324933 [Halteromyces radiatus]